MQLAALFRNPEFPSCSKLPDRPLSPVNCVDHTPRPHEIRALSDVRRRSRSHLGNGIKVTKHITQTVHVAPKSATPGPSSVKPHLSHINTGDERKSESETKSTKMQIIPSSTIIPVEEAQKPCPSPVVRTQRSDSFHKQRPHSTLLLSQPSKFEESPDFAAHYEAEAEALAASRRNQRRRSTSEESVPQLNKKLMARDEGGLRKNTNTKDLILFFQNQVPPREAEPPVSPAASTPQESLCGPRVSNPIITFKTASSKVSQFVHPKPVTVLSVASPTIEDIAQGQMKTRVVTRLYPTKRTNGKLRKTPMEVRERLTGPSTHDIPEKEGNLDGCIDLNAAENNPPRSDSHASSIDDDNASTLSQAEKWERWNNYVGRFGSADKFSEQVIAAVSGGISESGNQINIPVSKHNVPNTAKTSNLRQEANNAINPVTASTTSSNAIGKVVLAASRAPRRRGNQPVKADPAEKDRHQANTTTADAARDGDNVHVKSSSGEKPKDSPINQSPMVSGPATFPIPPPPRTSSRASSRASNPPTRQIGSFPSAALQRQLSRSGLSPRLSNEDFAPHREVAVNLHGPVFDGPKTSTSTLSVIESQTTTPTSPPLSPRSGESMILEKAQVAVRASTPIQYQTKTRAPTEPPMGPLPELPEGHARSITPSSSYRSRRSSRQTQPIHGRNNSSLASFSLSRAESPSLSYQSQNSPRTGNIGRYDDSLTALPQMGSPDAAGLRVAPLDVRSPTTASIRSMDSIVSSTPISRADRVRARKLRDTASIRARNENRALEERENSSDKQESPISPHLDQFPSIPLPLTTSQSGLGSPQLGQRPVPRRRSSALRNSVVPSRQVLSRSPICLVYESDPQTSRWRTACHSPSSTPTSPAFNSKVRISNDEARTIQPVRSKKSIKSINSISRNGTHTPPRSVSSTASSDEEGTTTKKSSRSITKPQQQQHPSVPSSQPRKPEGPSREDLLEQRIARLEAENRKYLAMIVGWLDPERALSRDVSIRSTNTAASVDDNTSIIPPPLSPTTQTSLAQALHLPPSSHMTTTVAPSLLPAAPIQYSSLPSTIVEQPPKEAGGQGRESYQTQTSDRTATSGISRMSDGRVERTLEEQVRYYGGSSGRGNGNSVVVGA